MHKQNEKFNKDAETIRKRTKWNLVLNNTLAEWTIVSETWSCRKQ